MHQETDISTGGGRVLRVVLWPGLAALMVLVLTVLELRHQGRSWWCSCGQWWPWAGNVVSLHNSQHFADPYSFTHVLHGVVLCGVLALAGARLSWGWRFFLAVLLEAGWELLENTEFVIHRYREATLALGYMGDSVINSMGDVVFCGLGFLIARQLGLWRSVVFVAVTELVLLFWIHDNLTLNVIMLVWPVDAIKAWQMAH